MSEIEQIGMAHRVDDDGLLWVVFDNPGERVNLLTADIVEALNRLLDEARRRTDVRGVLFASRKPGVFIAGMDVEQIAAITDSHHGAEAARFGQSVFQKIRDLEVPTVAVIGGTCLGGGTELALACTLRIASDGPEVKIGLPEVRLGIIPGFGGTQRLPRLIGKPRALEMMLTGRPLTAEDARAYGLINRVVPKADVLAEAEKFAEELAQGARCLVERHVPSPLENRIGTVVHLLPGR